MRRSNDSKDASLGFETYHPFCKVKCVYQINMSYLMHTQPDYIHGRQIKERYIY